MLEAIGPTHTLLLLFLDPTRPTLCPRSPIWNLKGALSILGPTSGGPQVAGEMGVCIHGTFSILLFNLPTQKLLYPGGPRDLQEGPGVWRGKPMRLGKGKLWPSGWDGLLEPPVSPMYQPARVRGHPALLPAVDTGMRWDHEAFLQ